MRPSRAHAPGALRGGIARDDPSVLFGGARRRHRRRLLLRLVPFVAVVAALAVFAVFAVVPARARTAPPEASVVLAPPPPADEGQGEPPTPLPVIEWKRSVAEGLPWSGRLVSGVQLPAEGPDWFTW